MSLFLCWGAGQGEKWCLLYVWVSLLLFLLSKEKRCHLSQMHYKNYKRLPPVPFKLSTHHTVCPRVICLSFIQEKGNVLRSISKPRPLKFPSFRPTGCKISGIQSFTFSQLMTLGIICLMLIFVHSTLSPFSTTRVPSHLWHPCHDPFLSQNTSLCFLLSLMWPLLFFWLCSIFCQFSN